MNQYTEASLQILVRLNTRIQSVCLPLRGSGKERTKGDRDNERNIT